MARNLRTVRRTNGRSPAQEAFALQFVSGPTVPKKSDPNSTVRVEGVVQAFAYNTGESREWRVLIEDINSQREWSKTQGEITPGHQQGFEVLFPFPGTGVDAIEVKISAQVRQDDGSWFSSETAGPFTIRSTALSFPDSADDIIALASDRRVQAAAVGAAGGWYMTRDAPQRNQILATGAGATGAFLATNLIL